MAMTRRRRIVLCAAAALAGTLVAAVSIGASRQRRELSQRVQSLRRAAVAGAEVATAAPDSLPPPVARYLKRAIPVPARVSLVRLEQTGEVRTSVETNRWMTFEAEHLAAPGATGFLWNARVRVAPLLHVRVIDEYFDGEGSGEVNLLSAFTVGSDEGTPELNSGALHRFLAEAVWYPTALLPSEKLRWTSVDERRALATLTDNGLSVSLEFRFADTGEVTGIYTPARWGTFGGGYEQHAWEGHFRNYETIGGFWVPREGDVGWYVGSEWRAVWRGRILSYETE